MNKKPLSILLVANFFMLSACLVLVVGAALQWPGTALEMIWSIYPPRRAMLMPYRALLGPFFVLLAVIMAFASAGNFLNRRWGWWLAVGIFSANGVGDVVQLLGGRFIEGGVGVTVAGAILFYLTRPKVRDASAPGTPQRASGRLDPAQNP
ncbi:MAG TPA: hypothetical protein VGI90_13360 [Steroidobacteraceae bacterium]